MQNPPALASKGCNRPFQRLVDGKFEKNSYRFTNFPLCFKDSFHSKCTFHGYYEESSPLCRISRQIRNAGPLEPVIRVSRYSRTICWIDRLEGFPLTSAVEGEWYKASRWVQVVCMRAEVLMPLLMYPAQILPRSPSRPLSGEESPVEVGTRQATGHRELFPAAQLRISVKGQMPLKAFCLLFLKIALIS